MQDAPLAHWLARLETLHPNAIDLGLERVARVARALELLPVVPRVVTVAGTNGKGSTVAVLEQVLAGSGLLTGVYTSPHLERFNERIRVGGVEAADGEIIAAFRAIDEARGQTSLTYFEFATLAALWIFRARSVDVLVLEVGLGGRLDAVNVVDPAVAVITRIDLDHQAWLGEDRDSIAREKAGILRSGIPAVIGDPEPPGELLSIAAERGASPVLCLGRDFTVATTPDGWQGVLRGADGEPRRLPAQPAGPLLPANISAGLQAALLLGCDFSDRQMSAAVAAARPRGRCERLVVKGREYLLDVAHNPAAVNNLVQYLSVTSCKGRTFALFSAMADKELRGMIQAGAGSFAGWFLADQPDNPRAASAAELAVILRREGQRVVSIGENLAEAFRRAQREMAEWDRLVVFGSFSTVAAVYPLLRQGCETTAVQAVAGDDRA